MSSQTLLPAQSVTGPAVRLVLPALGIGLLALGLLFLPEIRAAIHTWLGSTAYNHCFLVIPIAAYLAWDRRASLIGLPVRPLPWAALLALPLVAAWLVAERLGIMEGRQLIAMCYVELLVLTVLGWRLWRALMAPLLYLFFLVPFGGFLVPWLQDFTANFAIHVLNLLGIPNYSDGTIIEIPEGTFFVAEACAGLRFLIASVAFGVLYAVLMYRAPLRRLIFVAVSIVVPVIANGFRAAGIIALGHYLGSAQAVETDHILYGWIFFSLVTLLLIVVGLPFRQDQAGMTERPMAAMPAAALPRLRPLAVGAAALLAFGAVGPAVAAALDRSGTLDTGAALPPLALGAGCVPAAPTIDPMANAFADAPGRGFVQRFACGPATFVVRTEVFAPRVGPGVLIAEERRLSGSLDSEDVTRSWLPIPDASAHVWQMVETPKPARAVATALWVNGAPSRPGFAMRIAQARNSLFGGSAAPVLVTVASEPDYSAFGAQGQKRTRDLIAGFIAGQPALAAQSERLAAEAARPQS